MTSKSISGSSYVKPGTKVMLSFLIAFDVDTNTVVICVRRDRKIRSAEMKRVSERQQEIMK